MTTTDDFEFDELDELAAAYLDGEATPAEIVRIESDPEIQARIEEFRGLTEMLAEPVSPPPAATRDAAIAAAIAAAPAPSKTAPQAAMPSDAKPPAAPATKSTVTTEPNATAEPGITAEPNVTTQRAAPVTSLDAARAKRAGGSRFNIGAIAKVAAAVMVAFIGLTVLIQAFDSRSGDEVASVSNTANDTTVDAASDAVMEEAAGDAMDDEAMADDAMDDDAMSEPEPEAAMVDDATQDDAAADGGEAMEAEAMTDDATEDQATEDQAMEADEAADRTSTADAKADADSDSSADVDAEADLVGDGNAGLRYLLPDDTLGERADYLGDFESFDQFVLDYPPAAEGIAPRLVTPSEFGACDLSTLLPAPRAMLYVGTATIEGTQRLVGLEPDTGASGSDRVVVFEQDELGECVVTFEATVP